MKINAKNITLKKIESANVPAVKKTDVLSERFPWDNTIDDILEACRKNAYVVLDKHNNEPRLMRVGVWLQNGHTFHVVALPDDGSMSCINPIYLNNDGIPCLSTYSIGDNIWAGYRDGFGYHTEKNLLEGMAAYNWAHMPDGTEERHGHPETIIGEPMYAHRMLYAEGRHEKYYWNEDLEEVVKIRF